MNAVWDLKEGELVEVEFLVRCVDKPGGIGRIWLAARVLNVDDRVVLLKINGLEALHEKRPAQILALPLESSSIRRISR